jgi:hypothetical protein
LRKIFSNTLLTERFQKMDPGLGAIHAGANDDGAKLGANGDDAKVLPRQRQLSVVGQVAWGLGANVNGVKLCYLGVSVDGAKP